MLSQTIAPFHFTKTFRLRSNATRDLYKVMERHPVLLITEAEQARILRISPHHLINLRRRRLVPHVRLGKSVRYNPDEVAKAMRKLTISAR